MKNRSLIERLYELFVNKSQKQQRNFEIWGSEQFKNIWSIRTFYCIWLFYVSVKVSVNENFSTLLDFVFLDFWHEWVLNEGLNGVNR